MKVTEYRLRATRDGHTLPLCAPCFNPYRVEAFATALRGAGWTVAVEPFEREVFALPVDEPLLPVAPGPQPHKQITEEES